MTEDDEGFMRRWSRLKQTAEQQPQMSESRTARSAPAPARPLPSLESLGIDSDFSAFMQGSVEQRVRRAALKKLFSDPHFNVMDGLDTYIEDYTKSDPIPEEMLAQLKHARHSLFGPQKTEEQEAPPRTGADGVAPAAGASGPATEPERAQHASPAGENEDKDDATR